MSSLTKLMVPFAALALASSFATAQTRSILSSRLPKLGHRNWIVIADSAYPWQVAPGIETIAVRQSQIDVIRDVLTALRETRHVRPIIHLDRELESITESLAPGITAYKRQLKRVLAGRATATRPHADIIAKLDEAGKKFKVLIIKTPHTLPYTSVFMELDCGYWSADSERRLRSLLRSKAK